MNELFLINCSTLKDYRALDEYVFKKKGKNLRIDMSKFQYNKYFILGIDKDFNVFREYYFSSITVGACIASVGLYFPEVNKFIDYYEKECVCVQ